jgi:hypothetical protein
MVERVARALCRRRHQDPDEMVVPRDYLRQHGWPEVYGPAALTESTAPVRAWCIYLGDARAAVVAMLDPTDEMLAAMEAAAPSFASFAEREESPSYRAWAAALAEALG